MIRRIYTTEELEYIKNSLNKGVSIRTIIKTLKTGGVVFYENLKVNGINIPKEYYLKNKQIITTNPFENFQDKEVQYWLGWLASDGSIFEDRIRLGVKLSDIEIINNFIKFLGKSLRITYTCKNDMYLGVNVAFRNKNCVDFLNKLGITNNKSLTLKINFEITPEYLRGFTEGDGYIDKKKKRIQIGIGSIEHINQISEYLNKNNIKHGIYSTQKKVSIYHSLQIAKHSEVLKFINLIYPDNCTLYLTRKYNNAAQIRNDLMKRSEIQGTIVKNPEASSQNIIK